MTTDTAETAAPKKPSPVSHASRDALQKLGERIREARQRIGMNQLELAGDDLTRNMISRIETGSALPSIQTLCIIADRLSVPAGALLSDLDDYFAYRMAGEMRSLLEARKGTVCALVLAEASTAAGGTRLTGTLVDVDDEWVLVEAEQKKGGTRSVALRLDRVQGLEE